MLEKGLNYFPVISMKNDIVKLIGKYDAGIAVDI